MIIKKELLQHYLSEQKMNAAILAKNMGVTAAEIEQLLNLSLIHI